MAGVVTLGGLVASLDGGGARTSPPAGTTVADRGEGDPASGPAAPGTALPPGGDASPAATEAGTPPVRLLRAVRIADGDSFEADDGVEYRLGLVDAPERGECWAREATEELRRLLADGFTADAYATDRYGRRVAHVIAADGTDVNVHLAENGFVTDRYLDRYRHENPGLARRLEEAFERARAERRGLWGACPAGR